MALTSRRLNPVLSRLHLLIRLLGLTGFMTAAVCLFLAHVQGRAASWEAAGNWKLDAILLMPRGTDAQRLTAFVFAGAAFVVLLALVVEVAVLLARTAGRRNATGANALVQVGLASAIVLGINVYSFLHHAAIDCTRPDDNGQRRFTLPADVQDQLQGLRGETLVVILQQPKEAVDRKDQHFETAADKVVVEKVRDFVDQLRTLQAGRFEVVHLKTEDDDYTERLDKATKGRKLLRKAIDRAPGSSILFASVREEGEEKEKDDKEGEKQVNSDEQTAKKPRLREDVQRLSFDDFYQLEKTLSRTANGGKGNLVLLNKGIHPLARRVLNLEDRKPRIGILVVHEAFSSESDDPEWGLVGMKNALTRNGFDLREVILKKNVQPDRSGNWMSQPAVSLLEEAKFERLVAKLDEMPLAIKEVEEELKKREEQQKRWRDTPPANAPAALVRQQVAAWTDNVEAARRELEELKKELKESDDEYTKISQDVVGEQQRMRDLKPKLERFTADCDLLLVLRPSVWMYRIPDNGTLHRMADFQLDIVKDFMKAGKPVLACLGSSIDTPPPPPRPGMPPPPPPPGPDAFEELLRELNIRLSKHTIAYNTGESRESLMARRREIPTLDYKSAVKNLQFLTNDQYPTQGTHPLRESLARTASARGQELELRYEGPRAVYYAPPARPVLELLAGAASRALPSESLPALSYSPEFLWTASACWTTDTPQSSRRFEAARPDDPTRGTRDELRRGPFPVAVAVEEQVPRQWLKPGESRSVRLAVFGIGGAFAGSDLPVGREKLLLDTCNWLLGRDDLLTGAAPTWSFPRSSVYDPDKGEKAPHTDDSAKDAPLVTLTVGEKKAWWGISQFFLPALFLYFGLVVVLMRRGVR